MGFSTSCRWIAYATLSPQNGRSKTDFSVFRNNTQFQSMKSATKFRRVKTSGGKVVGQSISYEITEKYRTESVFVHLKYWLKLTYPVIVAMCMLARCKLSVLPNDVMYKIDCGQLHSERFGRRHSTLQSRGLFALAKPLYCSSTTVLLA